MSEITYAKVGGPPACWVGLMIIDLSTGDHVSHVIEVDTAEGWLERYMTGEDGQPVVYMGADDEPALVTERVEGRFEIRRPV